MAGRSVLVTGANRGIGLGLVENFLKRDDVSLVFATYRDETDSTELFDLSDPRLVLVKMEIDSDESIRKAFTQVENRLGDKRLDVFVNNAGILLPYSTSDSPNRRLLSRQMETNVVSATILSQIFIPLLRRKSCSERPAAMVHLSTWLASIKGNDGGSKPLELLAYRMSKTAVNMLVKTLAIDLESDGIVVIAICPGWVRTRMGTQNAQLSVDESSSALVKSVLNLDKSTSGGYFDRNLKPIDF